MKNFEKSYVQTVRLPVSWKIRLGESPQAFIRQAIRQKMHSETVYQCLKREEERLVLAGCNAPEAAKEYIREMIHDIQEAILDLSILEAEDVQ